MRECRLNHLWLLGEGGAGWKAFKVEGVKGHQWQKDGIHRSMEWGMGVLFRERKKNRERYVLVAKSQVTGSISNG